MSWIQAQAATIRREEGQDLVEYALLLGLIALIAIASVVTMGQQISTTLSNLASTLQSAL
ncbi:MAG: Flp family type IVb pilin [Chloroflexi bacterium]|nr:MAG: Flp family type IVb pilin [Chloroflexota bacterium]